MTAKSKLIPPQPEEVFLRLSSVISRTGLSKAEIYRRMKNGRFPRNARISHKISVWKRSEVDKWMQARFSGLDDLL